MKSRTFALFVAAAVTAVGLDLNAQSTKARKVGPAVQFTDAMVAQPAAKMDFVEIPEGSLRSAVEYLRSSLDDRKLPPMNIIFGLGAKDMEVPELTLRNVTGADALRLICTAADCEMEPIFSEPQTPQGRVAEYIIGYRISPQQAPTGRFGRTRGFISGGAPTKGQTIRSGPSNPFSASTSPAKGNAASNSGGAIPGTTSSARAVKTSGGGTRLVTYGGSSKPQLLTRVYALGRITTRAKFPEVEKTLLATLQVAGHKPSDATLALHETTNVLVVRATDDIHELVSNLLASLGENSADADSGEVANMERKLKALLLEMENLKQMSEMRVQEAEKRRRDAEDEKQAATKRLRALEQAQKISR